MLSNLKSPSNTYNTNIYLSFLFDLNSIDDCSCFWFHCQGKTCPKRLDDKMRGDDGAAGGTVSSLPLIH